jgi:hypothetical protein
LPRQAPPMIFGPGAPDLLASGVISASQEFVRAEFCR